MQNNGRKESPEKKSDGHSPDIPSTPKFNKKRLSLQTSKPKKDDSSTHHGNGVNNNEALVRQKLQLLSQAGLMTWDIQREVQKLEKEPNGTIETIVESTLTNQSEAKVSDAQQIEIQLPLDDALVVSGLKEEQHRNGVLKKSKKQSQEESQNVSHTSSDNLKAFLKSVDLTPDDMTIRFERPIDEENASKRIVEKHIPLAPLDQLVNPGYWGRFLQFFIRHDWVFKLIAYFFMPEAGIMQESKTPILAHQSSKQEKMPPLISIELSSASVSKVSEFEHGISKAVDEDDEDDIDNKSDNKANSFVDVVSDLEISSPDKVADQPAAKTDQKEDQSAAIGKSSSHIWPQNYSILFKNQQVLANVYTAESGINAVNWFKRLFGGFLLGLLINDITTYYQSPEKRYGRTLSDIIWATSRYSNSLSRFSESSVWMPAGLIALPVLLGIIATYRMKKHPTSSIAPKDVQIIVNELSNYSEQYASGIWESSIFPLFRMLLPGFLNKFFMFTPLAEMPSGRKYAFNNLLKTNLWDGNITAKDRLLLYNAIESLLSNSQGLLKQELLTYFAEFAVSIALSDIKRLYDQGYDKNSIKVLLYIKAHALATLQNYAAWTVVANYQLLKIGFPQTNIFMQLLLLLLPIYGWYALGRWTNSFSQAFINWIIYLQDKARCENNGKLFVKMPLTDQYQCTVCGDMPLPQNLVSTSLDCVQGLFERPRTFQELLDAIEGRTGKIDWSQIKTLTFDRQFFNGQELKTLLEALEKTATNLEVLYLNMTRPNIATCPSAGTCEELNRLATNATSAFAIRTTTLKTLGLQNQPFDDSSCEDVSHIMLYSRVENVDISTTWRHIQKLGYGCAGYITVGFSLTSPLRSLNLAEQNLGNTGIISLAGNIANSRLESLNLASNGMGDTSVPTLMQNLPSSLHEINFDRGGSTVCPLQCISAIGAQAIAEHLGNITSLSLWYQQSIGDLGAKYLGEAFSASNLTEINVETCNIGPVGTADFCSGLPGSSLKIINYKNNNPDVTSMQIWANALKNASIEVLHFSGLDEDEVHELLTGLPDTNIHELSMWNSRIRTADLELLGQASRLKMLDLYSCNLGDAKIKLLVEAFYGHAMLEALYFGSNDIRDEGFQAISSLLNKTNLQILDVKFNNNGGVIGWESLAAGISDSNLKELWVSTSLTNLPDETTRNFFQSLASVKTLETLYCVNNNLTASRAKPLFEVLPTTNIKTLWLDVNPLGDEGALELARVLVNGPPDVVEKIIRGEPLTSDEKRGLAELMPNTRLEKVELLAAKITDIGRCALKRAQSLVGDPKEIDLYNNLITDKACSGVTSGVTSNLQLPWPFRKVSGLLNGIKSMLWPTSQNQYFALMLEEQTSALEINQGLLQSGEYVIPAKAGIQQNQLLMLIDFHKNFGLQQPRHDLGNYDSHLATHSLFFQPEPQAHDPFARSILPPFQSRDTTTAMPSLLMLFVLCIILWRLIKSFNCWDNECTVARMERSVIRGNTPTPYC